MGRWDGWTRRAKNNYIKSLEREKNRAEAVVSKVVNRLQPLESENAELIARRDVVMAMIEDELSRQRTLVQTTQCREEIAFLEGLLKAFRPSRLTPEAWADQTIT